MQPPDPADSSAPSQDYIVQLRQKAQQAVQASVHHAELSQQYMVLSQRFSELAQQAAHGWGADLKREVRELEARLRQQTGGVLSSAEQPELSDQLSPRLRADMPSLPGRPFADNRPDSSSPHAISVPASLNHAQSADEQFPSTDAGNSATSPNSANPSGQATLNVRKVVERNRKAKLAAANRVRVRAKKADLQPRLRSSTEELKQTSPFLATSGVVLAIVLVLMSLVTWQLDVETPLPPMMASFAEEIVPMEEPVPVEQPVEEVGEQTEQPVEEPVPEPEPEPEPEPAALPEPESAVPEMAEVIEPAVPDVPSSEPVDTSATGAADGQDAAADSRSDAGRKMLLEKFGGSAASEAAVQRGLEWLISVQQPDGSWDFRNVGAASSPGTVFNPIGGTAYAVLPFLAAGQTHQSGSYQKQIGAALTYLTKVGVNVPAGYDLRGMINKQSDDDAPNEAYYVHGAATLALCEAYGMTKDRRLKRSAEDAVRFIVNSQDPKGGGWRYNPQEPGSTSVTAIQVMALMAGKKAGLRIDDRVLQKVMKYLDSVQVDGEGRYGYEVQSKQYKGSITAMALLCRMYLGWGRDDGDMRAGVQLLDKAGPYDNIYTLYFATQVMKNWGGEEWERWNLRLRDDLIAWQETDGPAAGSWKPRTGAIHAKQGGRLLTTALATLTLEVYYRYQPLLPELPTSGLPTQEPPDSSDSAAFRVDE